MRPWRRSPRCSHHVRMRRAQCGGGGEGAQRRRLSSAPRALSLYQYAKRHAAALRDSGRLQRAIEQRVIERFIECGDPHYGFARIYCAYFSDRGRLFQRDRRRRFRLIVDDQRGVRVTGLIIS